MPWFKVDDGLHSHPKAIEAGLEAMGLWVLAGSHCSFYFGQEGHITRAAALRIAGSKTALDRCSKRLVAAKLWLPTEDGWRFHEWKDFNPTAEAAAARKEARAAAGRLGGIAKARALAERRSSEPPGKPLAPASNLLDGCQGDASGGSLAKPCPVPVPVPDPKRDPPVAPQGGAQVVGDPNEPWQVPKSETRLARDEWIRAYTAGVAAGCGDHGWSFRPQTFATLERLVSRRCPPGARANIAAWLEPVVEAFVRAVKDSPTHWSGFSADGLERWWNAGRPGLTEVRKTLPPLEPEPQGEPLSADEQAEIDAILQRHPRREQAGAP